MPILKGRPAEYWAWRHASPLEIAFSRPLFEIVPGPNVCKAIGTFVGQFGPQYYPPKVITVDTGFLDQTRPLAGSMDMAVLRTARALRRKGVVVKPVMRLTDDPRVLQEVKDAAGIHGHGACLRLGWQQEAPDAHDAAQRWPQVCSATSLQPSQVDLLIDFGPVQGSPQVAQAAQIAAQILQWAHQSGPWRSVTVAAGAFPSSISKFQTGVATPVHRYDAELFDRIMAGQPPISPDYGDYGIVHPKMVSSGGGNVAFPNLKYTSQRQWQVYRENKSRPTFALFFDICRKVVSSSHWPVVGAGYSAGDAEIYGRTLQQTRTGAPTHWVRWVWSHHWAHVIDRLSSSGAP